MYARVMKKIAEKNKNNGLQNTSFIHFEFTNRYLIQCSIIHKINKHVFIST